MRPPTTFWGAHPAIPVLLIAYLFDLRFFFKAQTERMWEDTRTTETQIEEEQEESERGGYEGVSTRRL